MLPQYLGLYRLTVDGNETYVIVMRNILGRKYAVHKKYDLKGSTVQRAASDKERVRAISYNFMLLFTGQGLANIKRQRLS